MKPYRIGRIDEKDRVQIEYLCNNQWTLYIKADDFRRLSERNKLSKLLYNVDAMMDWFKKYKEIKMARTKQICSKGICG